jgi:hypothetical protein
LQAVQVIVLADFAAFIMALIYSERLLLVKRKVQNRQEMCPFWGLLVFMVLELDVAS